MNQTYRVTCHKTPDGGSVIKCSQCGWKHIYNDDHLRFMPLTGNPAGHYMYCDGCNASLFVDKEEAGR